MLGRTSEKSAGWLPSPPRPPRPTPFQQLVSCWGPWSPCPSPPQSMQHSRPQLWFSLIEAFFWWFRFTSPWLVWPLLSHSTTCLAYLTIYFILFVSVSFLILLVYLLYMYVCMYACMYLSMYVCMYVYMYVYAIAINIRNALRPTYKRKSVANIHLVYNTNA